MTDNFNNSFKFLEHLVMLYGELCFSFSETPYGTEFYWETDIKESDSVKKIEEVLTEFDEEYHTEGEAERGSSRVYVLKPDKKGLLSVINYKWDYSYLESKWSDEDLVELIIDEIRNTLSNAIGVSKVEFSDKYYYEIAFSTEDNIDHADFLLADWKTDDNVEISPATWNGLIESIIALSKKNGANTNETECAFNYNLNHEQHDIIESWTDEVEFDTLECDNKSYQEINT